MRAYYLKVMGIDSWTLRQTESIDLPACYLYELMHQGKTVGLLLACSEAADSEIESMLQKMITALKCESRGEWYSAQPEYSAQQDLRFVITLGEGLDLSSFSVPMIQSYSPKALMDKPKRKAETWQTLQAVFSYLS